MYIGINLKLIKIYYWLAKPNMVYGNLVTAIGGFLLASRGEILVGLMVAMLCGTGFIIGSACVFNNYFDRDIDSKMDRTKHRAMVEGLVSKRSAILYGTFLGLIGFFILARFTNSLTVLVGAIGFLVYVFWYTPAKHTSIHSTLIGTISGATPIVAGYVAATNRFDAAALILFLILVFWQMVHFYSIGIYRHDEYKAAGLPILPVTKGTQVAKTHIIFYLILFIESIEALWYLGYAGKIYYIVMSSLCVYWLWLYQKGLHQPVDEKKWARKMFFFSLIVIMAFAAVISFDYMK